LEPHRDKVGALGDRVGSLEDGSHQEDEVGAYTTDRVGSLEVGASK